MTLESIYRDVYSQLNLDGLAHDITFYDIVKSINDCIRTKRREYIQGGYGTKFSITETVSLTVEDTEYPFLYSATLTNDVMDSIDITLAVPNAIGYETGETIQAVLQSFNVGELALLGNDLYECVESFTSVATSTLTFEGNVRNYYRANGLSYSAGETVLDSESGSYYRVDTDFTATVDDVADNIAELTKVYWRKVRKGHVHVSKYPFYAINHLSAFNDEYVDAGAITVNKDKVYASKNLASIALTYIPDWTDVDDFAGEVDIPDFMVLPVKNEVVNRLKIKMSKNQLNPTPRQEVDNE